MPNWSQSSVAVFLPDRLRAHVRHVLINEKAVLIARSWDELNSIIRGNPVKAVVLDPAADGVMNIDAVATLLAKYPSLPFVAYVVLSQASFNAVAQLSKQGLENVVLHRLEDAPERFRATLERASTNPLALQALSALRPQINRLPVRLAQAVHEMFTSPHRYVRASDLALTAQMSSVRLYRNFGVAGLGSPKKLLIAAKLLRGYGYLKDPGYSIADVSKKLGYRNPRIFGEHCKDVFGLRPTRVRTHLGPDAVIERLVAWLQPGREDGSFDHPKLELIPERPPRVKNQTYDAEPAAW
jgi:AraC-like DNA-binding protein